MEQLANLTYEQYRAIAKDGDVIFLHGTKDDLLQRVIMKATNSPFCHVAFAFWVTINRTKRLMVVEAQGGTLRRIVSASYYKDRTISVRRCPTKWKTICDEALSQVGTAKYGYFDAIWVGVREFAMRKWGWRLPALNGNHAEICSEFVARMLKVEPATVSPGALYEMLGKEKGA